MFALCARVSLAEDARVFDEISAEVVDGVLGCCEEGTVTTVVDEYAVDLLVTNAAVVDRGVIVGGCVIGDEAIVPAPEVIAGVVVEQELLQKSVDVHDREGTGH